MAPMAPLVVMTSFDHQWIAIITTGSRLLNVAIIVIGAIVSPLDHYFNHWITIFTIGFL
jgi:hypothetical protein